MSFIPRSGTSDPSNDAILGDIERGLEFLRGDVTESAVSTATAFSADPAIWGDPVPTTLADAVNRIAAVVAANHGGTIP